MKTVIEWEEAFDKFGLGDGDGANFTGEVASFIGLQGYECECDTWGMHNYIIRDILKDGKSILPEEVSVGYDSPREWLPKDLVRKLDKAFA